jgi:hypothetical protein
VLTIPKSTVSQSKAGTIDTNLTQDNPAWDSKRVRNLCAKKEDIMFEFLGIIIALLVIVWIILRVLGWREDRQQEQHRQKGMAEHKRKWNTMTPLEQRAVLLGNYYIPENYLPYVVVNDHGEPCLPNFYLGGYGNPDGRGGYALMPMSRIWGGIFSEEEITTARNFATAKTEITTA